jgi:hypothetical protein
MVDNVATLVYITFSDTIPAVLVDISYSNHVCAIFAHPAGQKLKWLVRLRKRKKKEKRKTKKKKKH